MTDGGLVLASASPRRRELLAAAGLAFVVDPSDADESLAGRPHPASAARELAERKARAVAARWEPPTWVLGADTVVAVPGDDWTLLGKPRSEDEARAMLVQLSDTRHAVVTGVSVVRAGARDAWTDAETTWVRMRTITPAEIDAYVASGEWRDKAGGYAIQETADRFVVGLEGGGFDNVVGLPVALVLRLLECAGAPLARWRER